MANKNVNADMSLDPQAAHIQAIGINRNHRAVRYIFIIVGIFRYLIGISNFELEPHAFSQIKLDNRKQATINMFVKLNGDENLRRKYQLKGRLVAARSWRIFNYIQCLFRHPTTRCQEC